MRRILEAFTATSIPTGTFLLLMGMGSMGATPGLDSVSAEEPEELWATLQLAPPLELEVDLETPDAHEVLAAAPEPELNSKPKADAKEPAPAPKATPEPAPQVLASSARSERSGPFGNRVPGARSSAPKKATPVDRSEGVSHKAPKKKGGTCMDHTDAIVKVSSNKWTVERSFLEALASDRDAASRLAVLTWNNSTNGKVDGFKVRRVRCGSPLHQAGFRNGDVVHGVNGHKVTSIAEAIWTYGQVRKDKQLKVNLTRKDGSSAKLRYTVK